VLVNTTRADFKEFKASVEKRFADMESRFEARFVDMENRFNARLTVVENRLGALESDVAVIRAICQERQGQRSPV